MGIEPVGGRIVFEPREVTTNRLLMAHEKGANTHTRKAKLERRVKRKKRPSVKFKFEPRLLLDGGEGKQSSSNMLISSEDGYELPSSVMYDKRGILGTTGGHATKNKATFTASAAIRNASGARVRAEDHKLQGKPQDVQQVEEIKKLQRGPRAKPERL